MKQRLLEKQWLLELTTITINPRTLATTTHKITTAIEELKAYKLKEFDRDTNNYRNGTKPLARQKGEILFQTET